MHLSRHYAELPAAFKGGVVAIGNFDGVHLGHRAVIGLAREIAHQLRTKLMVLTFEPHPRSFFFPDGKPFRLTQLPGKAREIGAHGADGIVAVPFDAELAAKSAEDFIADILVDGFAAKHVVVGYDFVFGHRRRGDVALLQQHGTRDGFGVTAIPPVTGPDGSAYSSTRIRNLLGEGKPQAAAVLLGRAWEIEGPIAHGDARGRTIGFPTANVALGDYLRPAFGVYAVKIGIERAGAPEQFDWHAGVANLGLRPTIGDDKVMLEAHIFNFAGDIYGRTARVAMIDYIRPERKFAGLDELKAQIAKDGDAARAILAHA
ncbi:MAG: bifunctional riboflavin kinase/FAD synthetase [Alphaproteobacteria bacterium]